uniref:Galectin n=2 Tax=Meloidogyne TaxID=189290 RepID=A0A914LX33_MELIC
MNVDYTDIPIRIWTRKFVSIAKHNRIQIMKIIYLMIWIMKIMNKLFLHSIGNVNLLNYGFGIGFNVGKSIIMTGTLLNGGSCIKLGDAGVLLQTADAVFHFSPDNVAKHVICNSWMKGKGWTPEDKSGGYPFNANNQFELQWIAEPNNTVKINVDRIFWKRFSREDLSGVVQLDFSYAIRISSIKLCRADEIPTTTTTVTPTTPPPDVPCPYFSLKLDLEIPIAINLENGFKPGKHITIIGTPTDYFPDFVVGLGEPGIMRETANVLFSFSPQLNSKSVTVNTLLTGIGWETELTYGHSPFKVGEPFVLEIKAGLNNQIEVFVNYVAYLRFTRHDLSKVSQIQIIRAVKVCSIVTCY